jgi:Holliday junction resolvase RusA-like endonuclease
MTRPWTAAELAAYNAKRGGYAPTATEAPLPPDCAALLHKPRPGPAAFICTIPGIPVAKARPRLDKAGHVYTPEKTRAAEAAIRSVVAIMGPVPWSLAVRVEIDFYFRPPARMTREGVQKALRGEIRPILRVDVDNLGKLVLDAIQGHGPGHCFADDKQVAELVLRKWYGLEPRTVLKVTAL